MPPPQKKPRVNQKFRQEYTQMCYIHPSKRDCYHARCTLCECYFTIESGGASDIERHLKTKKLLDFEKVKSNTKPVSSFFKSDPIEQSATEAELLFNSFVVEHNLPMSVFDHAGDLFRRMFPDSNIAKKFACCKSKALVVTKCLASEISDQVADRMRKNPFTLGTDGSHDGGGGQMYPIVVRTFHDSVGHVVTDLLTIKVCEGASTGENIFNLLKDEFEARSIPWSKCIGFSCDNSSVMTGAHAGVAAFILKENEGTYINGCPCHLLHLAAKTGAKELQIDNEQVLTDIFFYMDKSSKRKKEFRHIQEEFGVKLHAVLKYGATRWLSIHQCVIQILEQWGPLQSYLDKEFSTLKQSQSQSSKYARLTRVKMFFSCPTSKLYCLFLKENLPIFTSANLIFQSEDPQIHRMSRVLEELMTDLIVRFLKPEVIARAANLLKIEFDAHKNQKSRKELVLGIETKSRLDYLKANEGISKTEEDVFVTDVRGFFTMSLKYIIKNFPITDQFIENAAILDISQRLSVKQRMLDYFLDRFPCLVPVEVRSALQIEFAKYQVDPKIADIVQKEETVDRQWNEVEGLRNLVKYPNLDKAMKGLCCLTHSNADVERVFSLVRKNQTVFLPNLSSDTVSAIVVQKVNMLSRGSVCHKRSFTPALISKAKSAYSKSLKWQ